jgi:hypothetical protein
MVAVDQHLSIETAPENFAGRCMGGDGACLLAPFAPIRAPRSIGWLPPVLLPCSVFPYQKYLPKYEGPLYNSSLNTRITLKQRKKGR